MFLAELAGRKAEMALEHLGEVVHIADAAVLGYRLHLQLGVPQQVGSGVHPHIGDILRHRLARLLMKQSGEIPRADIEGAGKVLQVEVGGGLGLNVGHRLLHRGRIVPQGVLTDETAVAQHHLPHQFAAFFQVGDQLDAGGKGGGDAVEVEGVDAALLGSLAEEGIADDDVVFHVADGVCHALLEHG